MTKDEKIAKLGKEITDRATVLLGKDKITPESPEYLGINSALKYTAYKYDQKMADDILDICLTMKKRVPLTIEQLAKKNPQFDRAYLEKAMQAVSESGLVEFHWENLDGKNPNHEKRRDHDDKPRAVRHVPRDGGLLRAHGLSAAGRHH